MANRDAEQRDELDNALYAPPGMDARAVSLMLTGADTP